MLDFDRINTSTRRASSGESFPWNCVEFAAAGWTGVWAWQPTAASARENVRARMDARSGFTTVNTIPRLSHAEYISHPPAPLQMTPPQARTSSPRAADFQQSQYSLA